MNRLQGKKMSDTEIGFILLRYVMDQQTSQYWIYCYDCIRRYYPESPILIIDDNSVESFITPKQLYKTEIIQSEFPRRGELLPYYYYLKHPFSPTAVILHDSVFINQYMDFRVDKYKFFWNFPHDWDQPQDEKKMILSLKNSHELLSFHADTSKWNGCFGAIMIITYDFLLLVYTKYDLDRLLDHVLTRYNRMSFERLIGCVLQKEYKVHDTLLGNIIGYSTYGISFHEKDKYSHLPIIKVWTGR